MGGYLWENYMKKRKSGKEWKKKNIKKKLKNKEGKLLK